MLLCLIVTAAVSACGGGGDSSVPASSPIAATDATAQGTTLGAAFNKSTVTQQRENLTVRARGTMAGNVGPIIEVRVNGVSIGTREVRSTEPQDHVFIAKGLAAGARIDVAFINDDVVNGEDRNLFISFVSDGAMLITPSQTGVTLDNGSGAAAYDGLNTEPGREALWANGALTMIWPSASGLDPSVAEAAAARFLQQATFGPTSADIARLSAMTTSAWLDEQMALPFTADYVSAVQANFDRGDDYRPGGSKYTPAWIGQQFWTNVATSPDQLRKRVGFGLHHIFMASQSEMNLFNHGRAYANYLDTLNKYAFGNFRTLLEEMALSPVMGLYLSHMRNRKEDSTTGRVPDENFARELMQLFTIGLYELNQDGSLKLDATGRPIETYNNDDVMALAKVFTGWSWAFPQDQLTDYNFLNLSPDLRTAADQRVDLQRMRAYPGQHSTAQKRLFAGKANAVTIPVNTPAETSLKMALDALFAHPNVGPFIGRQMIQRLTTSNPSTAYVARVAGAFANNGRGVRGDLGAVVRAILLDPEARAPIAGDFGMLREPVMRVSQWMRAFAAQSRTGSYMMAWDLDNLTQRVTYAPSVFGYFRPGYVPPNTRFALRAATAPEFQLVSEATTASWVYTVECMVGAGLGWTGTVQDVSTSFSAQAALGARGDLEGIVRDLNLLLFAGTMSMELKQDLLEALGPLSGRDPAAGLNRARLAALLAMASPEFLVQH